MQRCPVYRFINGAVMSQEQPGGRWAPVENNIANFMLKAFDGVSGKVLSQAMARNRLPVTDLLGDEGFDGSIEDAAVSETKSAD